MTGFRGTAVALVTVAALAGAALPGSAYHTDATLSVASLGLTASDWSLGSPFLILCESVGLTDARNPRDATHGNGGLCTTGWTATTHESGTFPPANAPASTAWTSLSVCSLTIAEGGGGDCPDESLRFLRWDAEIGVFACTVNPGYALHYQELYAFWTYDGDGGPAFHGHAAMFIDGDVASEIGVTKGSAHVESASPHEDLSGCGTSPMEGPVRGGSGQIAENKKGKAPGPKAVPSKGGKKGDETKKKAPPPILCTRQQISFVVTLAVGTKDDSFTVHAYCGGGAVGAGCQITGPPKANQHKTGKCPSGIDPPIIVESNPPMALTCKIDQKTPGAHGVATLYVEDQRIFCGSI